MGPRNEDRRRFLTAFGMGFCHRGNHATDTAYEYDGVTWCQQHPCPSGPVDAKDPGWCDIGRRHLAQHGVFEIRLPNAKRPVRVCHRHLAVIVAEVIRRGTWGAK